MCHRSLAQSTSTMSYLKQFSISVVVFKQIQRFCYIDLAVVASCYKDVDAAASDSMKCCNFTIFGAACSTEHKQMIVLSLSTLRMNSLNSDRMWWPLQVVKHSWFIVWSSYINQSKTWVSDRACAAVCLHI